MGNVITGHGQNWELGNGTLLPLHDTSTLVEHGQVGVHVSRVSTSAGNFFTGRTDLTKCVAVVCHVRVDDQHVVVLLKRKVLGSRQGKTRRNDSLNSRVVCEVDKQHSVLKRTGSLQVGTEEVVFLSRDTHGAEDDDELFIGILELGLACNLQCDVVVGKTRC